MRNFSRSVKNFVVAMVVAVMIVPMVAGIMLLSVGETKDNLTRLSAANQAFNGRESNRTPGTGWKESAAGKIGANLSESDFDDYSGTWQDRYVNYEISPGVYYTYTFSDFLRNVDNSAAWTSNYNQIPGDYRLNDINTNPATRGKTAATPWIISSEQELAFLMRFISLSMNASTNITVANASNYKNLSNEVIPYLTGSVYNAMHAYASAPYFQLKEGVNFDLGKDMDEDTSGIQQGRWVPASFYYPSNDTIGSRTNRFYLDGNGATISNAYVKQSQASGVAYPSVLGNLPYKSQVKNLTIKDSYVSQGATANPAAVVSLSASFSYSSTTNTNSFFAGITVDNCVAIGGIHNVNGITSNAGVIKDSTVKNTTLLLGNAVTTYFFARGIGSASAIINCETLNSHIEISNPSTYPTFTMGIGSITTPSPYLLQSDKSTTGDYMALNSLPSAATASNPGIVFPDDTYALNTTYGITGNVIPGSDFVAYDAAAPVGISPFTPGFYKNTLTDSKVLFTAQGTGTNGSLNNYGHSMGIGTMHAAIRQVALDNTVNNSLISVKTEENKVLSASYAVGAVYASYTTTLAPADRILYITNNKVLNSTVSAVTQAASTVVSGVSVVTNESIDARISDCYTENVDVESHSREYIGGINTYANGIHYGFATLIENCVVGSGNIAASNVKSSIFAYGIGSTLGGATLTGTTGTAGRQYFKMADGTLYQQKADAIAHGGAYQELSDVALTQINNCFNFSNITTSSIGTIYAAGIGMAEGFTNCINYGNVIGNWVGGIALGFQSTTNTTPGTPVVSNGFTPTTANQHGALRPLIIRNCANYGNLIKAENDINPSYMGGMFAIYSNSLNYQRKNTGTNGLSVPEVISEDLNGKYLEVTDCISAGKFFFYIRGNDNKYELTDDITKIVNGTLNIGMIFGRLNLAPYSFVDQNPNVAGFSYANFLSTRFVVNNNFYHDSYLYSEATMATDLLKLPFTGNTTAQATKIRVMELVDPNDSGLPFTYDAGGVNGVIENKTDFMYVSQSPGASIFSNVMGSASASLVPYDTYGSSDLATTVYEKVYNEVAKNWEGNQSFTNYSQINTTNSSGTQWNVSTNIPQMAIVDYPFQILAYDRNDLAKGYVPGQGYAPNVSILPIDEAVSGAFTTAEFQNSATGQSVLSWYSYNGAATTPHAVNDPLDLTRQANLPVFMLFADINATLFTINFTDHATTGYSYVGGTKLENVVMGEQELSLTYTNATGGSIEMDAIVWYVENLATGEWDEFWASYYPKTTLQPAQYVTSTFDLDITDAFIVKYAQGGLGGYWFNFSAKILKSTIHDIDVVLPSYEDGTSIGVNWDTYVVNGEQASALDGSNLMLTAIYADDLYDFAGFIFKANVGTEANPVIDVIDENDTYTIPDPDDITGVETIDVPFFRILSTDGATMQIQITGPIKSISFGLTAKEYGVKIQLYSQGTSNQRISLDDNESLVNGLINVGSDSIVTVNSGTTLEVEEFLEDTVNKCYYKFVGWENVSDSGTIISTESILEIDNASMIASFLRLNLRENLGGEKTFNVVAIFKRQVDLVVNMARDGFEHVDYTNSFKIYNSSSVTPLAEFTVSSGSVIVDENVQIRVEFLPDTRLTISTITTISENKFFIDNMLILTPSEYESVVAQLVSRPATVNVFAKVAHMNANEDNSMGYIRRNLADAPPIVEGFELYEDGALNLKFLESALGTQYRLDTIGVGIYSNTAGGYITFPGITAAGEMFANANSTFFKDFVNMNGECNICLFLVETYEVDLSVTAETTFRRDGTTYRYYDVADEKTQNSFTLTFTNGLVKPDASGFKFVLDYGTKITYTVDDCAYTTFKGVIGESDSEIESGVISIYSTRQLSFFFEQNTYALAVTKKGGSNAKVSSYNETFKLNSTITIAFDVDSLYSLNDIKINGTSLATYGAVRKGNSIVIKATPEFIDAICAAVEVNPDDVDPDTGAIAIAMSVDVKTGVSTVAIGGFGGGGLIVILLILLTIFLIIRSKKINEKRKKAEALAHEYERRFNIGGVISKLREDAQSGNLKDTKTLEAEKAAKEAAEKAEKGEGAKKK